MNVTGNFLMLPIEVDVADGSTGDTFTWTLAHPMIIHKVEFIVSEIVASDSTDGVVSLDYTPSGGSRTEYATITVPDATAVGGQLEPATLPDPLELSEGDIVIFEHKTQGADAGTQSGKGYWHVWFESVPDYEVA